MSKLRKVVKKALAKEHKQPPPSTQGTDRVIKGVEQKEEKFTGSLRKDRSAAPSAPPQPQTPPPAFNP